MHLDGARLWNAHIATGIAFEKYAGYFDSVSVCFSKGLGAPIGSAVAGSAEFIAKARRFRKMFGGGLRQVSVIAAAAIYTLDNNLERMAADHKNARRLAEELSQINGIDIDLETVQTNIVIMDIAPSGKSVTDVLAELQQQGVLAVQFGNTLIRCVAHLDVNSDDIKTAIDCFKKVFSN